MNRFFVFSLLMLSACAKRESAPLPGDSVSAAGSVSLKSPSLVTNATTGASTQAPLSPIESRLYPPELVMEHAADLGLTPAQKDSITKELDKSQSELVKQQWELQTEKDKLVKILDEAKVDETKSRKAADALMQKENAIKGTHLALLVRIKNLLTPEQQAKLVSVREVERCGANGATTDAGR